MTRSKTISLEECNSYDSIENFHLRSAIVMTRSKTISLEECNSYDLIEDYFT